MEYCIGDNCNGDKWSECEYSGHGCIDALLEDALALLKAQEPPTSESISSAIECLLHPQDADDSDMAKAIDTAVRAMRLMKAREPVSVQKKQMKIGGLQTWDWVCGNCGQTVLFSSKFCSWCGMAVKWK
jgi:rubrerythrin